ncbi:ABC transporter substrate-binding protein [Phaeacidiphilus oryzae]|uniref:ABC transporter substrate-binding protein n=1 Tax=Phaeacidiphilus oryzae TaxID=348818 RepID=UPI000B1A9CAE|nr:ABC transporter substrate-binding protein [Phaeacidiphilus oryzae]
MLSPLVRTLTATLTALVALLALDGCAALNTSTTTVGPVRMTDDRAVRDGGVLTVALQSDPDKLDPTLANTLVSRTVFAAMCQKLYDIDASDRIVPQLAAALPTTSADGRTVTIPIRRGARFSDGTPLTAQAVVTSIDRDRTLPGSARATELSSVTGAAATGPYTVRLSLSKRYVPLLPVLADRSGMVMSPTALAKYGKDFTNHPSCVGPFKFVDRVAGDRIVLTRDPDYYGASGVHLDGVVFKTITDSSIRLANLRSGDIQVGDQMQPVDVQSSLTEPKLQLFNSPSLGWSGIGFNIGDSAGIGRPVGRVDTPFAKDVRVREAFALSLDRDTINKVVFEGMYQPACSPVSPIAALPAGPTSCPGRNLAKARQLLRQAGVKTPVKVEMLIADTQQDSRLAQVIQAMAKQAGFDVSLRATDYTTQLATEDAGKFQLTTDAWSGRLDPDGNIAGFVKTGGALNIYGLSDPVVDRLVAEGRSTAARPARQAVYDQLIQRVNDSYAVIVLYRQKNYVVASKSVAGLKVYGDGLIRVTDAGFIR